LFTFCQLTPVQLLTSNSLPTSLLPKAKMRASTTAPVVAAATSMFTTHAAPAILPPSTDLDFDTLVEKREASPQRSGRLEDALNGSSSSIDLNSQSGPGNIGVIGRRPRPSIRKTLDINIKHEASPQRVGPIQGCLPGPTPCSQPDLSAFFNDSPIGRLPGLIKCEADPINIEPPSITVGKPSINVGKPSVSFKRGVDHGSSFGFAVGCLPDDRPCNSGSLLRIIEGPVFGSLPGPRKREADPEETKAHCSL
jgi:hypothetical protein